MSKARTLADFISDGSEFADGTISVAEVSGAAPLASPSFTGNATFDTNTLYIDGTNNRVGFGTTSPARSVTIFEDDQPVFQITNNTSGTANTRGLIQYIANGTTDAVFDNQGSGSGGMFRFMQAGTERLRMATSAFVVNEGGNDYDFRVESNTFSNMLFVDASNNNVNIKNAVVTDAQNSMNIRGNIRLGADTATRGDTIRSAGGASGAYNGMVLMSNHINQSDQANTSLPSWLVDIGGSWADGTNFPPSTADGITIARRAAGGAKYSSAKYLGINSSATVINEDSNDHDFRVESDGNTHALFVDAAQSTVGIGTSSTFQALNVNGNIAVGGAGNKGIIFGDNITSSVDQEWLLANNASASNAFNLYEYNNGTYVKTRFSIESGGDFKIQSQASGSVVINDDSENSDFRVESDGASHALFVDASTNVVTIGNSSAAHDTATKLQVAGRVRFGSGFGSETSGMTTPTNSMILTKESFSATSGATRIYGLSAQNSGYTSTGSSAPMAVLLGGWSNGSSYSGGIEYQPSSKELHIMGGTANAQTTFVDTGRLASFGQSQVVYNGGNQNYSDNYRQYAYSESVSSLFNNTTNGLTQQITVGNYLPYQHSIPVVVAFSYNGNGALTYTKFLLVQNDFNSITVQELYTNQSSTGIIQSVSFNTTGSYNTRRLQISATPASNYSMSVWNCVVYYGVAFH